MSFQRIFRRILFWSYTIMPKERATAQQRLMNFIKEIFSSDGSILFCKICDKAVNYEKKVFRNTASRRRKAFQPRSKAFEGKVFHHHFSPQACASSGWETVTIFARSLQRIRVLEYTSLEVGKSCTERFPEKIYQGKCTVRIKYTQKLYRRCVPTTDGNDSNRCE